MKKFLIVMQILFLFDAVSALAATFTCDYYDDGKTSTQTITVEEAQQSINFPENGITIEAQAYLYSDHISRVTLYTDNFSKKVSAYGDNSTRSLMITSDGYIGDRSLWCYVQ